MKKIRFSLLLITLVVFLTTGLVIADDKTIIGWGVDDPYNQLYDAGSVEKLKVVVTEVKEVIPMPGMSPASALMVKEDQDEEPFIVHICPTGYKKLNRIGLRVGDKISLRGYFTEINDEVVMMASKFKHKNKTIKVRLTSDGTPFWTMTPAQLQKELSSE